MVIDCFVKQKAVEWDLKNSTGLGVKKAIEIFPFILFEV
jgi:hypothetical protein